MRFSNTRWPQKNHIAGLVNKPQRAQFLNLPFVNGGLKSEVKLLEVLQERQVRQLQPGAQIAAPSRIYLAAQQLIEEIRIARFFLGSLLQQTLQPRFHRLESQTVQCGLQPLDRSHRAPPIAALS